MGLMTGDVSRTLRALGIEVSSRVIQTQIERGVIPTPRRNSSGHFIFGESDLAAVIAFFEARQQKKATKARAAA